jgi:hypothetical protein
MKKKILSIVVMMLMFANITTLAANININNELTCQPCLDPGDILFTYDVETPTDDNQCLGVEFDGTYFYVTGGGGTTHPDTNYVYFFDKNGSYLSRVAQPTTSDWGWRDIAYDGTYMYSSDSQNVDVWNVTGLPSSPVLNVIKSFSGPENPNRAMAYDPDTGHFWTANRESTIYEFDDTGTVINSFSNVKRIYSMAWDNVCSGSPRLWIYDQTNEGGHMCHVRQFDPVAGVYTGVEYEGYNNDPANDMAGGSCFIEDWEGKNVFIGLTQNTPDLIFCMEICQVGGPEPDLECEGDLNWEDITPGGTAIGDFKVKNSGETGSFLNWKIVEWPEWGNWTITPMNGTGLTPAAGSFSIDVEVVAPDEKKKDFTGKIKVVNIDDPTDSCKIDVFLGTPVSKPLSGYQFFSRIINQHPHMFPILRYIFGLH